MKELIAIQNELKVHKSQRNNFGNYNYRSCEDILEAVKPLCHKHNCLLTITDEMSMLGDRIYVQATATIDLIDHSSNEVTKSLSVSAYARESETKKGMDASQITGSASSYARKYALNGLFCIDDTKDADTMDNSTPPPQTPITQQFEDYKRMTGKQKGTLKDQIIELEKNGSESCNRAVTAVMELLGNEAVSFDSATHMINKVKLTLEKANER